MYLSNVRVEGLRASADDPLEVDLPGRFSVVVGANAVGKTTIADALYLAHGQRFPSLSPPSAAALATGSRSVQLEYSYEASLSEEGPAGRLIAAQTGRSAPGTVVTSWQRRLRRSLGRVRATPGQTSEHEDLFRFIYLPAGRNPLDELAKREARILVELLRAEQQHQGAGRNLGELRARASGLLESLAQDGLIAGIEARIQSHLHALTAGVSSNWSYVRGQVVDDTYLARVLELMLAVLEGRDQARPLEVSGLGYVNLLHIAVTLAAIPDQSALFEKGIAVATDADTGVRETEANASSRNPEIQNAEEVAPDEADDAETRAARDVLAQAEAEAESEEDSFFPSRPVHITILIEEPEAHLHPQLQHALVRHLRRMVQTRPELQLIISSHATDVITSCDPTDIVVLRRDRAGRRAARTLASIPYQDRAGVLRKARLHLDASRSAAIFAERALIVEGVTDAAVAREFGWVWAGTDNDRQAFIDALSIVPVGTKVGSWLPRFLATRGHEICNRLAVLRDSDVGIADTVPTVSWAAAHNPDVLRIEHSHPTLEPSLVLGNEDLILAALGDIGVQPPPQITATTINELFRSQPNARKGEFALAIAGRMAQDRYDGAVSAALPEHFKSLFDFLHDDPMIQVTPDTGDSSSADASSSFDTDPPTEGI